MRNSRIAAMLVIVLALACGAGAFLMTSCSDETSKKEAPAPEPPPPIVNPLTGETADQGFDESAVDRRIVAFVVENAPEARPQWGMDDPEYSPDMVVQGEVEGGITRTLWLYADANKLPEQIGPMRSARPPYIKFAKLFDAIFIHWGMSHSKGDYIGASSIFNRYGVDHINQMGFSNECGLFDRDHSRGVSQEHTGIVYGDKVPAAIEEYGCRTEPKEYTKLNFNEPAEPMSDILADEVPLDFSSRTDWETSVWKYNEEDKQYHNTENFENDFKRDNLLILFDGTKYITKEGYQGPGSTGSVTYCNYDVGGGEGKLLSQGTVKDITWKVEDHKFLYLIDTEATKAAQAKAEAKATEEGKTAEEIQAAVDAAVVYANLNPGKTWVGWASSNNGGKVEISPNKPKESEEATDSSDSGETTEETEAAE